LRDPVLKALRAHHHRLLVAQIFDSINDKHGDFYDVKRKLARFYVQQVLPETASLLDVIINGSESIADFNVAEFDV